MPESWALTLMGMDNALSWSNLLGTLIGDRVLKK